MNEPVFEAKHLARRILECETCEHDALQAHGASSAIEKLRLYLTKFVGPAGFQALFTRAVALAKPQAPWLASVELTADGTLVGLDEESLSLENEDARTGELALLTQLLDLLITFIGQSVTLHMAREIWSDRLPDDLNSNGEETKQ